MSQLTTATAPAAKKPAVQGQKKIMSELPEMPPLSKFAPILPATADTTLTTHSTKVEESKPAKRDDVQPTKATFDLTPKQKQDIKDAFNAFDTAGIGYMNVADLKVALRAMGFEPKAKDIKKIVENVDKAGTGKLCFNDFMNVIAMKMAEKDSKDEILKAFKLFDRDGTGYITFNNLQQIAVELGEGLADEEVHEMIQEADLDGDGMVSMDEFFRIMKKTSLY